MKTRHMTAILVLAASGLWGCGERAPEGATLIRAARLYVAPDAPAIDDAAVLIVAGRIAAVGPAAEIPAGGAAGLGQCDGGTLVAGFQNSHVHFIDAKFAGAKDRPAAELTASMNEMLNRYGFTMVVDTASDLANTVALRARVEGGDVAGPRILTAGDALLSEGWHSDLPARPAARVPGKPRAAGERRGSARERAGESRWRR